MGQYEQKVENNGKSLERQETFFKQYRYYSIQQRALFKRVKTV